MGLRELRIPESHLRYQHLSLTIKATDGYDTTRREPDDCFGAPAVGRNHK